MNYTIDISSTHFLDQVYGCWMGKNCGGILGVPLERILGEPKPFDVWWYPKLEEVADGKDVVCAPTRFLKKVSQTIFCATA